MVSPNSNAGRRPADTQLQREDLLIIAAEVFGRCGIKASSLRSIAVEAGVTPALFNYYFGKKSALVSAVAEELLLPKLIEIAKRIEQADQKPDELASVFVREVSAMVISNPWVPPLWVREILCEGGLLREYISGRMAPILPRLLAERFAHAQQHGTLNPSLDPRLLVVSLIGLTLLPFAAGPIWRNVFDNPPISHEQLVNHTLSLLQHGMET
ncbi:TetR/AcrR family transcriptional regulator [Pseudomonas sp.]|uniref:TetR/AcrR family transcriptional regulator n=1 Tax=Pseudomonas sp. TaxID=306 RepID=UPI00257A3934|nr:TetR/AcrR family transcriptional regulator [Pseudomonas sp.]